MTPGLLSDVAFTGAVKSVHAPGTRAASMPGSKRGGFRTGITPDLLAVLAETDTAH